MLRPNSCSLYCILHRLWISRFAKECEDAPIVILGNHKNRDMSLEAPFFHWEVCVICVRDTMLRSQPLGSRLPHPKTSTHKHQVSQPKWYDSIGKPSGHLPRESSVPIGVKNHLSPGSKSFRSFAITSTGVGKRCDALGKNTYFFILKYEFSHFSNIFLFLYLSFPVSVGRILGGSKTMLRILYNIFLNQLLSRLNKTTQKRSHHEVHH